MANENARRGIGRIYTAEILSIIAAIISIVATVLMTLLGAAIKTDGESFNINDVISIITLVVGLVIAIVAFFLNLTGIRRASEDEPAFSSALIALIGQIVLSVLSTALSKHSFSEFLNTAESVCEILVTYFVICGCINLAKRLNKEDVATYGKETIRMIFIVWIAGIILDLISGILGKGGTVGSIISAILGIAALVCMIITYIMYLRLLRKTINIL